MIPVTRPYVKRRSTISLVVIVRIGFIFLCLGQLSACVSNAITRHDVPTSANLSNGPETSIISGSNGGSLNGLACHPTQPAHAEQITVDSGWVELLVGCYRRGGVIGEQVARSVSFTAFDAKPGHRYRLVGTSTCAGCGPRTQLSFEFVAVIDESDGDKVILRTPLAARFDMTVDIWKTSIVMLGSPSNDFHCGIDPQGETEYSKLDRWKARGHGIWGGFLKPSTALFTVRCVRFNDPLGTRSGQRVIDAYAADLKFEAEVSHIYVFDIDEHDPSCISVNEVSRGYRQLACESSFQLKAWIGKSRDELPEPEWGDLW